MFGGTRSLKLVSALGFILLASSLVFVLLSGPVVGYELSIYEALPRPAWLCMLGSVAIGFGIGVRQALSRNPEQRSWWAVGLAIVLLNNLVFLLLPVLRGYALYGREDVMTHVGYAVDVISTGSLSGRDVYPVQHLFVATVSAITGLSPMVTTGLLAPLLSMFYVGCVFCLALAVFADLRLVRLATLLSTVLLFSPVQYHSSLVPFGVSAFLIPLAVYAYFRSVDTPSVSFSIISILVVGVALPFVHPLAWTVICATLVAMGLARKAIDRGKTVGTSLRKVSFTAALFSAVVFLTWFFRFYLAEHIIKSVYDRFFGPGLDSTMMERVFESANRVHYQWFDVAFLLFKMSGHSLVYIALTVVAIALVINKVLKGQAGKAERNLVVLIPAIAIPGFFFLLHVFATLVEFGILRLLTTTIACAPLFASYALLELAGMFRTRYGHTTKAIMAALPSMIIACLVFICWIFGFLGTFGWSFIRQPNQQATQMELAGVSWLLEHKDPVVTADANRMISRFGDAIVGTKRRAEQGIYRLEGTTSPIGALPDHFGQPEYERLGDWYALDFYVPLSAYDQAFHTVFFPEFEEFDQDDFGALFHDHSAHRVFADGEFEIWYINSSAGQAQGQ